MGFFFFPFPPSPQKSGRTPVIHCTYGPALSEENGDKQVPLLTEVEGAALAGRLVALQEGSDELTCYFGSKMGVYAAAITSWLEKELKLSIAISV